MDRFLEILGAMFNGLGRMVVAVVRGIWTFLVLPILGGVGDGLGALARIVAPWIMGGVVAYAFWIYNPQGAEAFLQSLLVLGIVILGIRTMFRRPGRREGGGNRRH